jgi:hypothetical protein
VHDCSNRTPSYANLCGQQNGIIPHSDGTVQASTSTTTPTTAAIQPAAETSASFEAGRNDWHHYHD